MALLLYVVDGDYYLLYIFGYICCCCCISEVILLSLWVMDGFTIYLKHRYDLWIMENLLRYIKRQRLSIQLVVRILDVCFRNVVCRFLGRASVTVKQTRQKQTIM